MVLPEGSELQYLQQQAQRLLQKGKQHTDKLRILEGRVQQEQRRALLQRTVVVEKNEQRLLVQVRGVTQVDEPLTPAPVQQQPAVVQQQQPQRRLSSSSSESPVRVGVVDLEPTPPPVQQQQQQQPTVQQQPAVVQQQQPQRRLSSSPPLSYLDGYWPGSSHPTHLQFSKPLTNSNSSSAVSSSSIGVHVGCNEKPINNDNINQDVIHRQTTTTSDIGVVQSPPEKRPAELSRVNVDGVVAVGDNNKKKSLLSTQEEQQQQNNCKRLKVYHCDHRIQQTQQTTSIVGDDGSERSNAGLSSLRVSDEGAAKSNKPTYNFDFSHQRTPRESQQHPLSASGAIQQDAVATVGRDANLKNKAAAKQVRLPAVFILANTGKPVAVATTTRHPKENGAKEKGAQANNATNTPLYVPFPASGSGFQQHASTGIAGMWGSSQTNVTQLPAAFMPPYTQTPAAVVTETNKTALDRKATNDLYLAAGAAYAAYVAQLNATAIPELGDANRVPTVFEAASTDIQAKEKMLKESTGAIAGRNSVAAENFSKRPWEAGETHASMETRATPDLTDSIRKTGTKEIKSASKKRVTTECNRPTKLAKTQHPQCLQFEESSSRPNQEASELREQSLSPDKEAAKRKKNQRWEEYFQSLERYYKLHKTLNVPRRHDRKLSTWVDTQRAVYRQGRMLPERQAKLDNLGLVWDVNNKEEKDWNRMFTKLVEFKMMHGDMCVPSNYVDKELVLWVRTVRKGRLFWRKFPDRIARLDSLGFTWWRELRQCMIVRQEVTWQNFYEKLFKYRQEHGHSTVDKSEDAQLYAWVNKQRDLHRLNELSQAYVEQLNKIDFEWDPREEAWDAMLAKLVAFKQIRGHCNVPGGHEADKSLSHWVTTQRTRFCYKTLDAGREKKLREIGFEFVRYHKTREKREVT